MTASEADRADTVRAALLLSNRLTRLDVPPLKAREFWALVDRTDALDINLGALLGEPSLCDSVASDDVPADRLRALLGAMRAFAFEVERLDEAGVHLLAALDSRFPSMLRDRMGHGCPPHLFAAGAVDGLALPTLSIVGDVDGGDWAHDVARRAVAAAVVAGWSVATPDSSDASDLAASTIDEALACDASVVALAAAGVNQVAREPALRRLVQSNAICLASPFAPDASASGAAVRARNSMLHALGSLTLVVSCADGTGPTWAAAFEAVEREPGSVVTVVDANAPTGNKALADLGAQRLDAIDDLHGFLV
jgi:predicted Rossmann fold nucleotide-binding protein DprA/Smf involved in DNA uptake